MAVLSESMASARFTGDTLDPDEVTALLGSPPTRLERKGEPGWRVRVGVPVLARTGVWSLEVPARSPGDLDAQVAELLDALTMDLAAWRDLTGRFRADLFCGLFVDQWNEGVTLSARTLLALGERGLELDLDIYAPARNEPAPGP